MVHLIKLLSRSPRETIEIGERIGRDLSPGDAVALTGVLGSGKSVLARGILRALGVRGELPSPSFIIVASYKGRKPVNHIDLYRLRAAGEAAAIGIEDLLLSDDINVIEWAEKISEILPESRIEITIGVGEGADDRLVTIVPSDDRMRERFVPLARDLIRVGT